MKVIIGNYNIDEYDFKKMIDLLEILPEPTGKLAMYFLSKVEAYRNDDISKWPVLFTLREYGMYPELQEYVNNRLLKANEIENDYDIGLKTYLFFMKKFGSIPHDDLSSLSPLNFCKLFIEDVFRTAKEDYIEMFDKLCVKEEKEYEAVLTERLLLNTNIEVQSYYKTVASIYNYLQNLDSISLSKNNLKTTSMILAMFYYKDTNEDFNVSKAFKECFPYIKNKDILIKYLGIDVEDFEKSIQKSFDVGDLIINFKEEIEENDIILSLKKVLGKKNNILTNLCTSLGIDDDKIYSSFDRFERLKVDSISDEEIEKRYVELMNGLPISDINVYNVASIIYKQLDANPNILSYYTKTPDKLATLSLLLGMYVLNHKDITYLENDSIFLEDILSSLEITDLIDQKYKLIDIDKRTIVFQFAKFLEDKRFRASNRPDNSMITNIFINGNRTFLKLLFISLDRDYDVIFSNIKEHRTPQRPLTIDDLKKILAKIKPELDIHSKESIANYGIDLMKQVNSVIDSMLKLSSSSDNEKSFSDIREGIDEIYETKEEKSGFLSVFRRKDKEVIIHFEYVNDLNRKIDENISRLLGQMRAYELIELRNKLYSQKLKEFITVALDKKNELIDEFNGIDKNSVFEVEDYNIRKRMLDEKIRILETSYRTMEGHFLSVGIALLSTNSVINTLTHIRNDFIPLLSSNMLISIGATSTKDVNLIAKNVIELTRHYLTDNIENARQNLGNLQALGIPEDNIRRIESDIEERTIVDGSDMKRLKLTNK